MRPPLEYGDNFPVPAGSWNPAVPWRFPKVEVRPRRSFVLKAALPFMTLVLGMLLGVLWMGWRSGASGESHKEIPPVLEEDAHRMKGGKMPHNLLERSFRDGDGEGYSPVFKEPMRRELPQRVKSSLA